MTVENQLKALLEAVVSEANENPRFAARLRQIFAAAHETGIVRKSGRRAPGQIDPFAVYSSGGEEELRRQLATLSVEQLKDVVAEHGMDQAKLAMKWKTPDRLIDHIVGRVRDRAAKGDAFRVP